MIKCNQKVDIYPPQVSKFTMRGDCEELFAIHHRRLFKKIGANTPITRHYFYTQQLLELLQKEVKIKLAVNPF